MKKAIGLRSRPALPSSSTRSPGWTAASRRLSSATPMRSSSAACRRSASAARGQGFCTGAAGLRRSIEFGHPAGASGAAHPPNPRLPSDPGLRRRRGPGSICCRQTCARCATVALRGGRRVTGLRLKRAATRDRRLGRDPSAASAPAISQTQGPFNAAAGRLKFCGTRSTTPQRRSPADRRECAGEFGRPAGARRASIDAWAGLRLSRRATGADGFYIATLTRTGRMAAGNPQCPNWNAVP